MDLNDADREMLRLVKAGRVMRLTTPLGDGSYERADSGDLDWDLLDRLAGRVGTSSREHVELTKAGEEAAGSL